MIWLVVLACFFIGFLFSGIESGVLAVNRVRLRHHARLGDRPAQQLHDMLDNLERLMITVLLVTNTATIIAVVLLFREFSSQGTAAGVLAVIVAAPIFVFGMEFLPKAIFRRFPYRTLSPLAKVLGVVHVCLRPIVNVGAWLASKVVGSRPIDASASLSAEEVRRQIAQKHSAGDLSSTEREMIDRVLDFRRVSLEEVMIPMAAVYTVSPDVTVEEIFEKSRRMNIERFPVRADDGFVPGLVQVYDLAVEGVKTGRAQSHIRRMVTVPIDTDPYLVLQSLRSARMTLALVVKADESPAGIVSTEDIVTRLLRGK